LGGTQLPRIHKRNCTYEKIYYVLLKFLKVASAVVKELLKTVGVLFKGFLNAAGNLGRNLQQQKCQNNNNSSGCPKPFNIL
jgi:hypothetical protein